MVLIAVRRFYQLFELTSFYMVIYFTVFVLAVATASTSAGQLKQKLVMVVLVQVQNSTTTDVVISHKYQIAVAF